MSNSIKRYLVKEAIVHGEYQGIGKVIDMPEQEAERYVLANMLEPVDGEVVEQTGKSKKTSSKKESAKDKNKNSAKDTKKAGEEDKDAADNDPEDEETKDQDPIL